MGQDTQELYDKADMALYHAKLDPHHHIALYNELMKEDSREGMGLSFTDLATGEPASVLIYRYDETEEILYANDNCLKLFGCEDMQEFMKLQISVERCTDSEMIGALISHDRCM